MNRCSEFVRQAPVAHAVVLLAAFVFSQGQKNDPPPGSPQAKFEAQLRKELGEEKFQEYLRSQGRGQLPGAPKQLTEAELALFDAVNKGQLDAARQLLDSGVSVKIKNRLGETPLCLAAAQDRPEFLELFLTKGADINDADNLGTPLWWAANKGHLKLVEWLLGKGADPNKAVKSSPIGIAAVKEHLDVIELLAAKGASHDVFSSALTGNVESLKRLLQADPDLASSTVTLGENQAATPLHLACAGRQAEAVGLLLDAGAKDGIRGDKGRLPVELADNAAVLEVFAAKRNLLKSDGVRDLARVFVWDKKLAGLVYLLDNGIMPTDVGQQLLNLDFEKEKPVLELLVSKGALQAAEMNVLAGAIFRQQQEGGVFTPVAIVETQELPKALWLIEQGHPLETRFKRGATEELTCVLNHAILYGDLNVVRALIEKGANVNPHRPSDKGTADTPVEILRAPLCEATRKAEMGIIKLLVEKGSDINPPPRPGVLLPLQAAVAAGRRDVAEYLISKGANTTVKDASGKSLSQLATENKHDELAKWLKSRE